MKVTKVKLGKRYRDIVTGFVGIAVCRTEWMNGCNRVCLQPPCGDDGKIPDVGTFDEVQMRLVDRGVPNHEDIAAGPRNDKAAIRR